MAEWLRELFDVDKPIVGMCHLPPLPGDPFYEGEDFDTIIERVRADLWALQNGGVDGILFSNEFSLPYVTKVPAATIACMARIIGQLYSEIRVPFGVDVLWDPFATLDLAAATEAKFAREVFSGVYASDFGLWSISFGEVVRHKKMLNLRNLKLFFNVVPESAKYLADREITDIVRTTIFNHQPDGICVSGLTAGVPTNQSMLRKAKEAAGDVPVFANTGVSITNVEEVLSIADGAFVGTFFKRDGKFDKPVDEDRVKILMEKVRMIRAKLAN